MLRRVAHDLASGLGEEIVTLYAELLGELEESSVLDPEFDGQAAARKASTLRELQLVQVSHDRAYHPDVFGMSRADQVRHYAFHLAKLAEAVVRLRTGSTRRPRIKLKVPGPGSLSVGVLAKRHSSRFWHTWVLDRWRPSR